MNQQVPLDLVFTDRHEVRVVDDHVGCLEQRIAEEPDARQVPIGELIDLLIFFEFVPGRTRRGLVARQDVDWMFANFIERVVGVDFVRAYILRLDFDELHTICRRVEKRK